MNLRNTLQTFFDRNEVAWEIFMIVLAVIFVALGFLPDLLSLSETDLDALEIVDWSLTGFFGLEFLVRILVAPSRKVYFREHWLDLIAIVPVVRWLRFARFARLIRLLRLARLVRALNSLDQFEMIVARIARMNGLQWLLLAFTVIMLVTSGLLYLFEEPVNDKVQSYWDALYASLVTWTTPGYGDVVPITTNGRICGLVLIISGLITWGILIANLSAFLSTRRAEADSLDPVVHDIQHKLARVDEMSRNELIALRGVCNALLDEKLKK